MFQIAISLSLLVQYKVAHICVIDSTEGAT